MFDFDVVVIGGGSAGFAAAGRAVEQGARVALVEGSVLGGDCPNRACVPTKILLRSAEIYNIARNGELFGVTARDVSFDFGRIMARKERIVSQLTGDRLRQVLDRRGISLFTGAAAFKSDHELTVDDKKVTGAKFIIATGSRPGAPAIPGLIEAGFITSNEAVNLTELPASVAIIGGGAVGVEFAQIFSRFDVKTTIVEAGPRLLAREDFEISELLKTYLQEEGVDVLTGVGVGSVSAGNGTKTIQFAGGAAPDVTVAEIMVAVGRIPAIGDLELARAGVRANKQGVLVDEDLKTSAGNIWACGDVTGKLLFTHIAAYEGDLAGYNAVASHPDRADYSVVPRVTFCDPEVAGVGLTESEAGAKGPVLVGRMPYRYLGKALIHGEHRGLIKIIVDGDTRRVIGGHIVGAQAGELIHEIAVAIGNGMTVGALAEAIHAYPTFSEGVEAAAADALAVEGMSDEEKVA